MPGRKPKPTALKQLAGNPGKRALNKREPKPPRGPLDPAPHLSAAAAAKWRELAKTFDQLGLLTTIDRMAFEAYCEAWARWCAAKRVVAKKGLTYETGNGLIRKRPEVQIAAECERLMRQYAAEFGATPSSRSRVQQGAADQPMLPGIPAPDQPAASPVPNLATFSDADFNLA
ncbi:phage terminase small subunit P27 family [Elioraea sp.]|uniref:phage terminase small subunit P27 family n=1 Tax=Elioraea sp. TaxID=2185103 RepID=UPI0025C73913|nr:phage terminase small subunit P27 family [Elioraea sp.]